MGSRYVKNNSKVNRNGAKILASIALVSALSATMMSPKMEQDDLPKRKDEATISFNDNSKYLVKIIENVKSHYSIKNGDNYTIDGLIFKYFEDALNGLSVDEQNATFERMMKDPQLYEKIASYVNANYHAKSISIRYTENDLARENIDLVLNNERLMEYITTYCKEFGVDENEVIAIIAHNVRDGKVSTGNPLGISQEWYNLGSMRTVFSFSTNNYEDLRDYSVSAKSSLNYATRYGIMALANAAKECNGRADEALGLLLDGPSSHAVGSFNPEVDEILSYLIDYYNEYNYNIVTTYVLSDYNKLVRTDTFADDDYHLYSSYNSIISQIRSLYESYNNKMIL